MRTMLDIPDKVFKKTKRKLSGARARAARGAALEEAMAPQLRFLAMNRAQRAKAFLAESKAMARFYAAHAEELLPDFCR